jgi:hypothetical protein
MIRFIYLYGYLDTQVVLFAFSVRKGLGSGGMFHERIFYSQ